MHYRYRNILTTVILWLMAFSACASNRIYDPQVKSLVAVVNQDWLSPTVMRLQSNDVLHVGFDELSHDYHRYIYKVERCEADWTASEELFESDWLEGFNNLIIDDIEYSINTTVPYTHYELTLPNDMCQLKMSGNYRLHIYEDGNEDEDVLTVEFMVTEQTVQTGFSASTNTDIDTNNSHQQLTLEIGYQGLSVTRPDEQLMTVVMQNGREDNWRRGVRPTSVTSNGLTWHHCRDFIFEAGNEYHKFEVLDPSHPTMGIDKINWDGSYYQAYPFVSEPRLNYLYDEDANGAFYIRNSDNRENNTISDYVWVNYRLKAPRLKAGNIVIDGRWTTESPETYLMTYDDASGMYTARILQKQGYYSYQYLWLTDDGIKRVLPSEGNFYQTENRYQVLVYYKGIGERTWRLVGYRQIELK